MEIWVPMLFGAVIVSTGFLFSDIDDTTVNPHLIDVSGFAGALLTFALLGLWLKPTLINNVITWVSAGVVGAIAPNLVILVLDGKLSDFYKDQLPIGLISYSLNITLCAILLSGIRFSLNRARLLRQSLIQLESARANLESQIRQMRGEIRESVDGELRRVNELLSQPEPEGKLLGEAVMKAIDEVIRPLSHRLAGFGLKVSKPDVGPITEAIVIRKGVALSRLAGPELYLLLFLVFFMPATYLVGGLSAVAAITPLLAVKVLLLFVIRRKATALFVDRGLGIFLLALLAGIFVPLSVLVLGTELGVAIGIGFVNDAFVVSGLLALISKRVDVVNELRFTNKQSQQVVQKLSQEVWVTRTKLAKAIHGAVQAKFLAIALRLQAITNPTEADIELARQEVAEATELVAQSLEADRVSFLNHIDDYRTTWGGLVGIELQAEPGLIETIDEYPLTRSCAVEVIGEAIANAAKHSRSPNVLISAEEEGFGLLRLSIASEGRLSETQPSGGYGSQILGEVTRSWSLTERDGKVTLTARLPLNS